MKKILVLSTIIISSMVASDAFAMQSASVGFSCNNMKARCADHLRTKCNKQNGTLGVITYGDCAPTGTFLLGVPSLVTSCSSSCTTPNGIMAISNEETGEADPVQRKVEVKNVKALSIK